MRYLKNGCASAIRRLRDRLTVLASGIRPAGTDAVLGGLNGASVGRRLTAAARAAGIEGRITGRSGRIGPCQRAHPVGRQHDGIHVGGRLGYVAHGGALRSRRHGGSGRRSAAHRSSNRSIWAGVSVAEVVHDGVRDRMIASLGIHGYDVAPLQGGVRFPRQADSTVPCPRLIVGDRQGFADGEYVAWWVAYRHRWYHAGRHAVGWQICRRRYAGFRAVVLVSVEIRTARATKLLRRPQRWPQR